MKELNTTLCAVLLLSIMMSCEAPESNVIVEKDVDQEAAPDTTPRVTGIGGIFFQAMDPAAVNEWYGNNLGLVIDDYGSPFEFRNANDPDQINYLRWSPFGEGSEYFQPSQKDFMINYRVVHMEALVEQLKANGVTILDDIETYEYGKFVHIMGPEGTKIELWEPVDSILTKMGGATTK